jgi:hypothetical protein
MMLNSTNGKLLIDYPDIHPYNIWGLIVADYFQNEKGIYGAEALGKNSLCPSK